MSSLILLTYWLLTNIFTVGIKRSYEFLLLRSPASLENTRVITSCISEDALTCKNRSNYSNCPNSKVQSLQGWSDQSTSSIFPWFSQLCPPLCVSSAKLKQFEASHPQPHSPEQRVSPPPSLLPTFEIYSNRIHLCHVLAKSITVARGHGIPLIGLGQPRPTFGARGWINPTQNAWLLHNGRVVGYAWGSSQKCLFHDKKKLPWVIQQPPMSRC